MDGLDDLETEAQKKRRKSNRRSEITPPSRHPRKEAAAQNGPARPQAGTPAHGHTGVPVHAQSGTPANPDTSAPVPEQTDVPASGHADTPASAAKASKTKRAPDRAAEKRTRPPSIEAYLSEDLVDWLWQVRAAGVAQRKDNVTSAVVRLALEELRQRRTPKQIIDALDATPDPGPTKGRRGRRR